MPEAKPYPGRHRIHGVEVVPVSVLLADTFGRGSRIGASTACRDIRFDHPIVVDQPRVIQVVADGESVTVSSSPAADAARAPLGHAHVSARIAHRTTDDEADGRGHDSGDHEMRRLTTPFVGRRASAGVGHRRPAVRLVDRLVPVRTPAVLAPMSACRRRRRSALLDAAVHVARLVDGSDPRLMVPAAVGQCSARSRSDRRARFASRYAGAAPMADELIVDIAVKAADGSHVHRRSARLRYAEVESASGTGGSRRRSPHVRARDRVATVARGTRNRNQAPDSVCDVAVSGQSECRAHLCDSALATPATWPADVDEARYVVYVAEPGPATPAETDIDCCGAAVGGSDRSRAPAGPRTTATRPRCGSSLAVCGTPSRTTALRAELSVGTRRRHRRRAARTVGRPGGHPGRWRHR